MPADVSSLLVLILLNAAATVRRLWIYVAGGVGIALLLSRWMEGRPWPLPRRLPKPATLLLAPALGALSPLPTLGTVPIVLQFVSHRRSSRAALAFVSASMLTNPQMFLLTAGAMGPIFAGAQLACVLMLGAGLGMLFGHTVRAPSPTVEEHDTPSPHPRLDLVEHIGFHFLTGVLLGATLQVALPLLPIPKWSGPVKWLAIPLLGWLGAPLYTCGGSAIPTAAGLLATGIPPGALFVFLLAGPAMRGTALAALGMLLPHRARVRCLAVLLLAAGGLGYMFEWLWRSIG